MIQTGPAFDRVCDAVRATGRELKSNQARTHWRAKCPAHNGQTNTTLIITPAEGKVLLWCHGGCDTDTVLAELKLQRGDLYDAPHGGELERYQYTDARGRITRTVHRGDGKRFWQSGDTSKPPHLYRLPKVVEAVAGGTTVYLVEGEKDVHALEAVGLVATTGPQGADNIDKVDLGPLKNADVVAVPDRDAAGQKWLAVVRRRLDGYAASLRVVEAVEGKDAADHIAAGYGVDEFKPVDDDQEMKPSRRLVFTPASQIVPRPTTWIWDTTPPDAGPAQMQGRFPAGSLVIAAGRAGLGKSQFAAWLTARITTGTLPGHLYGRPRGVVYAASEDSWEMTIVPRLIAAGANLDLVFRIGVTDDDNLHARLTLPTDTIRLEAGIEEYSVVLVVLDPLLSLIDSGINDYRAKEVREALEPLVAVADRTRCLLLGLAHFTKATGSDPLMLISGSGAFGQLVRAAVGFARDEEAEDEAFVLSQIKNNLGRENLPSLKYVIQPTTVPTPSGDAYVSKFHFTGEESERSVRDLLRSATASPDEQTAAGEAVDWLRGVLDEEGPTPAKEIKRMARAAGIAERTLDRARSKIGAVSKREGFGKDAVYVWALPSQDSPDTDSDSASACSPHVSHARRTPEHGEHGTHVASMESDITQRDARCMACSEPLDAFLARSGEYVHPGCDPRSAA